MTLLGDVRKFMSFQNLEQLIPVKFTLFDGSTIKIARFFNIEIVEITGVGAVAAKAPEVIARHMLLFLINDTDKFDTWIISSRDNTISLRRFEFPELPLKATKFAVATHQSPSTVQSNSTLKEHRYTVETIFDTDLDPPWNYIYQRGRFGVKQVGLSLAAIAWDLRNAFQPEEFDIEKIEFEENLSYLNANSDLWPIVPPITYPVYLCSGRKPWEVVDGKVRKFISMWAIDANNAEIRYNDESGVGKVGRSLSVYTLTDNNYYAVLSSDKYIGLSESATPGHTGNQNSVSFPLYIKKYAAGNCEGLIYIMGSADPPGYDYYTGTGYKGYMFGDVVLEGGVSGGQTNYYSTGPIILPNNGVELHGPPLKCCGLIYQYALQETWEWAYTANSIILPMCYDNLDNDDETFIILYCRESVLNYYYRKSAYWALHELSIHSGQTIYQDWRRGCQREYKMAYRIEGGSVVWVPISTLSNPQEGWVITEWPSSPGSCGGVNWLGVGVRTNPTKELVGTRPFNASCKVTSKYIVYTYSLYDWDGSSADCEDFDSHVASNWSFVSRRVGVISIRTGVRKEFTLNSDLDSSLDETLPYAIGIHRYEEEEINAY
jgi:hypothetical protein